MFQLGDIAVDGTAYCYFPTFDSDGASVTITGLAVTDIEIFADGVATTRASDNGYALLDTDGIDFDGMVGIHGFKIDLSDNSDAGFYVAGSHYMVAVDAITVDSQTVRFLYVFTIGQLLRPTTTGRTLDVAATGEAGVDLGNVTGTLTQANVGWVDANSRVDVGQWLGTAPLGLSSQRVQVDVQAIDALASAATVLGLWLAEGVAPIADSGTTTTLVDAVLTQADGHWNGALLIFRTGTNIGRTAIITDFDAATDTLTFAPAVPDAVTTEGYVLVPGLGHADITAISQDATAADNLELQYDTTGLTGATFPAPQSQVQGIAATIHGRETWYVATDGNDGNTGRSWDQAKLTPKTVIEAASANDLVILGPGTWAMGDVIIDVPNGVSVRGAGMDVTTLTSTATFSGGSPKGVILKPGTNSEIEDLTVRGIAGGYQAAFGVHSTYQADFQNAVIRRCRGFATNDCVYIHDGTACSWVFKDCIFESGWDTLTHNIGTGHSTYMYRCHLIVDAANVANGVRSVGGKIWLADCHIDVESNGGVAHGVDIQGASSELRAHNTTISTLSPGGTAVDIYQASSGTIRLYGCDYDRSKRTGTIVDVSHDLSAAEIRTAVGLGSANLDTQLADVPTNTEMAAAFTEIKGATWADTDTLEAIRNRGDDAWVTAAGFSTHTATNVWEVGTRVLTAGTNLNDPTAAEIADAVWDEAYADHVDAGSFGILIGAAFEEV